MITTATPHCRLPVGVRNGQMNTASSAGTARPGPAVTRSSHVQTARQFPAITSPRPLSCHSRLAIRAPAAADWLCPLNYCSRPQPVSDKIRIILAYQRDERTPTLNVLWWKKLRLQIPAHSTHNRRSIHSQY